MPENKVEKFNQLVRSMVTLGLTGAFIYGFLTARIDAQNFVPVVIMAIGFWFGARGSPAPTNGAPPKTPPTPPTPGGTP